MYESALLKKINFKTLSTLPQIYDNSLTEYEMMCRLADKVNEIILSLNNVDDEIKSQIIEYCKTDNLSGIVAEYLKHFEVNVKCPPLGIPSAVGDGVTDDTESIKQCIAYAVKNKLGVVFPAGKYLITDTITLNGGSLTLRGYEQVKILNKKVLFNGLNISKLAIIHLEVTGELIDSIPANLILNSLDLPTLTVNTAYSDIKHCNIPNLYVNGDYCNISDISCKNLTISSNRNKISGIFDKIVLTGGYNIINNLYEDCYTIDNGVYNAVSCQNVLSVNKKHVKIKSDTLDINSCVTVDNGKNIDIDGNTIDTNVDTQTQQNETFVAITEKTRTITSNKSVERVTTSKNVTADSITENTTTKNVNAENLNVNAENIKINKEINTYSNMFNSLSATDKNGNKFDFLIANDNTHKVSGFEGNTHTNTHFRYYVDGVNGNDENDGRTQAKAFKTLQKVFELINKGQSEIRAFIVSSGVYTVDVGNVFNGVAIHLTGKVDGVTVRFISGSDRIAFYNSHVNYQNIRVECSYSDVDILTDTPPMGIYYENTAVYFNLVNHAQTGNITFYGCYVYLEDLTAYTIECLATNGFIHELIIKADKLGLKAIQIKHGSTINFYGALKAENLILNDTENASCFIYVNGAILQCRSSCPSNFKESIGQYHWGIYAVNSIILMNTARLKTYSDYSTNGIFVSGVQFLDISDYNYNSFNDLSHLRISTLDTED